VSECGGVKIGQPGMVKVARGGAHWLVSGPFVVKRGAAEGKPARYAKDRVLSPFFSRFFLPRGERVAK